MNDYTELKRMAERAALATPWYYLGDLLTETIDDSGDAAYIAAASPDVVLEMIDALDIQGGSIEAVQAANQRLAAERDELRTQNQALLEALKELTDCGAEAWGEDRPCVREGRAAIKLAEGKDV
jgi:hypothetical protein